MTLQRMLDRGTIQSKTEGGSYGRLTGTPADLFTGWHCTITKDFSAYARAQRGRGGREAFLVIGKPTSVAILRGYVLVIDSIRYEIVEATEERDPYGAVHHWSLRVEKMV